MNITVDAELCEAHGDCVVAAPEIFDLGDDDEVVQILTSSPGPELAEKAALAARLCPVAAILVSD